MASVTYDKPDTLADFSTRRNIGFTMLADPASKIIRAFGVENRNYAPGSWGYGVAHPIIFVIDAKGAVTHRFSSADYRSRPDVDAVLKALGGRAGG